MVDSQDVSRNDEEKAGGLKHAGALEGSSPPSSESAWSKMFSERGRDKSLDCNSIEGIQLGHPLRYTCICVCSSFKPAVKATLVKGIPPTFPSMWQIKLGIEIYFGFSSRSPCHRELLCRLDRVEVEWSASPRQLALRRQQHVLC